ncbi:MAG: hypothetical protein QOG42_988, partial [Solirubrobacteraceae bacterium]|nr:hypothetical protein [Solirubrobacteraceae bacterium]
QLRAALQTFEALGAAPWSARAREELAASGERARARGDTAALDDLTPHELRVATVVAQGATNREAALALFLSPKTVEAHLHSIYRKLGIRSRSELAALATAGGLQARENEMDERRRADARR